MIGYIKGKVVLRDDETITVRTGGVGYRIFVSETVLGEAEEGKEVELYVWTHLRQTALDLYGCSTPESLEFFKLLEGMSGIGPKIALSLVHFSSPEKLKEEIESKGKDFTKQVRGLGQKKLRQLLLELTGKVKELEKTAFNQSQEEAVTALKGLGFSTREAKKAVTQVIDTDDPEKIVEEALKAMGKK